MTMRDRNGQSEVESTVVEKKNIFPTRRYAPVPTSRRADCWNEVAV